MPTPVSFCSGSSSRSPRRSISPTTLKTRDYWFRGFPALWNVAVLYLFVLRLPWPGERGVLIVGTASAIFRPVVFVHPLRVEEAAGRHHRRDDGVVRARGGSDRLDLRRRWPIKARFLAVGLYFPRLALRAIRPGPTTETGPPSNVRQRCAERFGRASFRHKVRGSRAPGGAQLSIPSSQGAPRSMTMPNSPKPATTRTSPPGYTSAIRHEEIGPLVIERGDGIDPRHPRQAPHRSGGPQ